MDPLVYKIELADYATLYFTIYPSPDLEYECIVKCKGTSWINGDWESERAFSSSPTSLAKSFKHYQNTNALEEAFPRLSRADKDWILYGR